jgi:hypothetical protein
VRVLRRIRGGEACQSSETEIRVAFAHDLEQALVAAKDSCDRDLLRAPIKIGERLARLRSDQAPHPGGGPEHELGARWGVAPSLRAKRREQATIAPVRSYRQFGIAHLPEGDAKLMQLAQLGVPARHRLEGVLVGREPPGRRARPGQPQTIHERLKSVELKHLVEENPVALIHLGNEPVLDHAPMRADGRV